LLVMFREVKIHIPIVLSKTPSLSSKSPENYAYTQKII